jgi:chromosome segregation ATPase
VPRASQAELETTAAHLQITTEELAKAENAAEELRARLARANEDIAGRKAQAEHALGEAKEAKAALKTAEGKLEEATAAQVGSPHTTLGSTLRLGVLGLLVVRIGSVNP